MWRRLEKQKEIFSNDGNLKVKFPTLWEERLKTTEKIKEKDSIITKQQKELCRIE